ncbi:MAG: hypothetical protein A3K66_02745 [Euryarchaeota archaeon RBG_16_67_27]|nr:MAG: hypothetical protein A3K66_02745 [Euryarchaeota archaeon RBG_16_67_27]
MAVRPAGVDGVYTDGSWLYTRNLTPGRSVYGESLHREGDVEYRRWDANRSKLAAYLKRGGRVWPFAPTSAVLYLGAASGTTVSHVSDVCAQGNVLAVEIAPRPFRDLVRLAESRANVVPFLGDAARPEAYRARTRAVDVVYQDVAQRDQETIFLRNLDLLRSGGTAFLLLKARSTDVAADPAALYRDAIDRLRRADVSILDTRRLDPFAADHAAIVVRKG